MQNLAKRILSSPKVVVELGMGDGRLLESLARHDPGSLYIGIELDGGQCRQAESRMMALGNVVIVSASFEEAVPAFPDASIDRFIVVLPDPAFIDQGRQEKWAPFYHTVYAKLKKGGQFQLVAEITDKLLQPVDDYQYAGWAGWLKATFQSIGFALVGQHEGAPAGYSSRCLDQFRGDPERIRMSTINLVKSNQ